jgi:hypothetical protein
MTAKYYIANNCCVDHDTQIEIINNGEIGDAKVTLCTAKDFCGDDWYYYLNTNGDPVFWCDDAGVSADILDTLEQPIRAVVDAIIASSVSSPDAEWVIGQIEQATGCRFRSTDNKI